MKQFRVLKPDEIECRVSQCTEKGVSILLYKTARTDADLLDETVGAQNWENDFKLVDGVLYGGIGVDYVGDGKKIWKWDAGTESNTEAEKGRASDAFKRAGFKHGIGRELYSAPFIWIDAARCKRMRRNEKTGKWQCYDQFDVTEISYDEAERIKTLSIASGGTTVYTFGQTGQAVSTAPRLACADCKGEITQIVEGGTQFTALQVAEKTRKRFGRCLCWNCASKA